MQSPYTNNLGLSSPKNPYPELVRTQRRALVNLSVLHGCISRSLLPRAIRVRARQGAIHQRGLIFHHGTRVIGCPFRSTSADRQLVTLFLGGHSWVLSELCVRTVIDATLAAHGPGQDARSTWMHRWLTGWIYDCFEDAV
jgi:hypothetical protein